MARTALELLADIDKDTVGFVPNFDNQGVEPTVLPGRLPQLLINGSSGIAVGMATNIPPHNLGEIADATVALLDDPETSDDVLADLVHGPDFPTGGTILGREAIREAYRTGRGSIAIAARPRSLKIKAAIKSSLPRSRISLQVAHYRSDCRGALRETHSGDSAPRR